MVWATPGDGPALEGRAYDPEIIATRDTIHAVLAERARNWHPPVKEPSRAEVMRMLDDAALKCVRDAGTPVEQSHPVQRRVVAALELPRGLDNDGVRSALALALSTKWRTK